MIGTLKQKIEEPSDKTYARAGNRTRMALSQYWLDDVE